MWPSDIKNPAHSSSPDYSAAIAIIGVGCRFPGGVHDLASFWSLLREGVDAITDVPPDRFNLDTYYDPAPATPGKIVTRRGGFLSQPIDLFDADFFGISPREAAMMDPQQRLLLETTWEALEDAGLSQTQIAGSRAGVFVGMWANEYEDRIYQASDDIDLYNTTGGGRYAASGRISYLFDLQGPSLTVDTHCSSSLVAVHLACQSLRTGESELALAGASNLMLTPQISIAYSRSNILSPDGQCRFGDASANGYVRAEGVGMLVLKPLARALTEGDAIHAVILGSATNNDGRGSGLLVAPSEKGQAALLRAAYRNANIQPRQVGYVEAHGTGTLAGDPVELGALSEVLREDRPAGQRCAVGSVKTNIGHCEAAAGLAGLLKVVLCLKNHAIPASLHFHAPNPNILWDALPLYIQNQYSEWNASGQPLIAGVSSFGITGTNAHVVLAEAPADIPPPHSMPTLGTVLPLSARSPDALASLAGRYADNLTTDGVNLNDLLYTASRRRSHHAYRLALPAQDPATLAETLRAFSKNDPLVHVTTGQTHTPRKIAFIFPGQGSQWLGMGRQLYQTDPTFREVIQRCDQTYCSCVEWSLIEQLTADEAHSRLDELDIVQPVLFAIEVALAETWRAWGVEPDAVVGHSMGEDAAAYIAGALSLEDAARIICIRSRLMRRISGKGGMAVVDLTLEQAQAALAGYEDILSIAVSNGPRSTVISGDPGALQAVMAQLDAQGVFVRAVKVDAAAHSPQMDPLRPELVAALAGLEPRQPTIPIYSTVTGEQVDFPLDAEYWGRNLRQPVLFWNAIERMAADGYSLFIEISPHPILLAAINRNGGAEEEVPRVTIPSLRRGEDELDALRLGLAQVYCQGGAVHWEKLYPHGRGVKLAAYPWQRERFWAREAELIHQPRLQALTGDGSVTKEAVASGSRPNGDQPQETTKGTTVASLRASLLAVEPGRPRRALLKEYLQQQAAQVLRLPPARVDVHKPLRSLGMDSLMAVEFRNRLESGIEQALSATLVWNYPTVNDLILFLAEQMDVPLDAAMIVAQPREELSAQVLDVQLSEQVDALSDDEVAASLEDELNALDDLL